PAYVCSNRESVTVVDFLKGIPTAQRSFAQPRAAFTLQQRDAQRRAKRGAEAPGQRAAPRRLLPRVSRPVLRVKPLAPITRAPLLMRNGDDVKNGVLDEVDD